jgi:hypothetical protein
MKKVFADYHHSALYHSLQLLFEKRLGWKLYRAIGPEWYHEGYWMIYNHPHTVNQFLGLHQATEIPMDIHGNPLTENERKNLHYDVKDGIYYIMDPVHECNHRAITLDRFKDMDFDIVLSSIPAHIAPYNKLISLYQPRAKHIFQVGNCWGHLPGVRNILASTAPFDVPVNINLCNYHQEFDLNIFRYEPPSFHNVVHSYVHYMKNPEIMDQVATSLPGWQFTKFGAGMDMPILEARGVADSIRRSSFTWHYKPEGDGFGHCHSEDTEVLTNSGWKQFVDLKLDDKVGTIDQNINEVVFQYPTQYHKANFSGDLLHFQNGDLDILVTPNHRMWVERYNNNVKNFTNGFILADELAFINDLSPVWVLAGKESCENSRSLYKSKLSNSPKKSFYRGYVYCVSVPNETVVTRRNGKVAVTGNSIFSSFACGRPAIIWSNHYTGKLASKLFEHGKTCIDFAGPPLGNCIEILKHYSQPEEHVKMCEAAYQRFSQVIDFDHEFDNVIKPFLERLI